MTKLKRHVHFYHLTRLSANQKLGGLPASSSSRSTCPDNCSLKDNGCYGEQHPMRFHWDKLSAGIRGTGIDEHCTAIRTLPLYTLWRLWQVGDWGGHKGLIDEGDFKKIVHANRGRKGFAFSHYNPRIPHNGALFKYANSNGLAVNASAETLEEADEFVALGVGPVVVLLPMDQTEALKTPAGNTVMVCPTFVRDTSCAQCGICAQAQRDFIVGFPAHGSGKAKAQAIFFAQPRTEAIFGVPNN